MLNSNLGGGIPGYMGESEVKATSPTDPHLSDPHAAANEDSRIERLACFDLREHQVGVLGSPAESSEDSITSHLSGSQHVWCNVLVRVHLIVS